MAYNYNKEFRKFKEWKENEEQLLRHLNVEEKIINDLHDYDVKAFKLERNIKSKQFPTRDIFFLNIPYEDIKEIKTVSDFLGEIEDETIFSYLSKTDRVTLNIILFRMLGYSVNEISNITGIKNSAIHMRINRLKKILKKM